MIADALEAFGGKEKLDILYGAMASFQPGDDTVEEVVVQRIDVSITADYPQGEVGVPACKRIQCVFCGSQCGCNQLSKSVCTRA